MPQSKKTGADNTRLKLLHNHYIQGKLQINKDGLSTYGWTTPARPSFAMLSQISS